MSPTISEIAEAFSRHEFDRTFRHMDDDIEWAQMKVTSGARPTLLPPAKGRMSTTYAVEIDSSAADRGHWICNTREKRR